MEVRRQILQVHPLGALLTSFRSGQRQIDFPAVHLAQELGNRQVRKVIFADNVRRDYHTSVILRHQ